MIPRPSYHDLIRSTAWRFGKMAFVSGPRQVGKTTLARQLLHERPGGVYHLWDDVTFKRQWMKDPLALVPQRVAERPLVVFDELHKAPRWKSHLKGVYDLRGDEADILVTGSARLDLFRRGGDSLVGRYFTFRLHPFSVGEVEGSSVRGPDDLAAALEAVIPPKRATFQRLMAVGGFPEPFVRDDPTFARLWRRTRTERLIREDLLDLTRTREIGLIETAYALLDPRVGSPLSFQSLAEDLSVSAPTVRRWLEWLEQLYLVFLIKPYTRSVTRSLRKRPKLYMWDWTEIDDEGARFENLVASHLLKATHLWTDAGIGTFDLHYVRDKEGREVDLLVTRDGDPWLLAECKLSARTPSKPLLRFSQALRPAMTLQIVGTSGAHDLLAPDRLPGAQLISADAFLGLLP